MSRAFKRGTFYAFRATNKIHLGKYETDILANDEFDYDGHVVRYAGMEYAVPQLRGLMGDWFVPIADTTTRYKSKPAGVKVSHATPEARERGDEFTMEEASEEEAVVGTMTEQTALRKAAANGDHDRLAEIRAQRQQRKADIGIGTVPIDSNPNAPPPQNAADVDAEVEAALMDRVQQTFIQAQPAHSTGQQQAVISGSEANKVAEANVINQARIAAMAEHLEQVDPRKTREEMGGQRHSEASSGGRAVRGGRFQVVEQDDGQVVGKYNFSAGAAVGREGETADTVKAVNVATTGGNLPVQAGRAVASTPKRGKTGAQVINDPATLHEPQAVRAVSTTQVPREGNVGIDEIRPGGATGDVDVTMTGDDLESLLPGAAVAGRVVQKRPPPPVMSEDEEITEIVDGWSTKRNWQKRVQEAVEFYGDWPELLDAICAIESPKVAEQIRKRLAN